MANWQFQSTGSSRSPTSLQPLLSLFDSISIHRLLAEPDGMAVLQAKLRQTFQSTGSSRSPTNRKSHIIGTFRFQSTGSSRSPTPVTLQLARRHLFQSTGSSRSPTFQCFFCFFFGKISIHRLLAEPDRNWTGSLHPLRKFQSTGSSRSPTIKDGITYLVLSFQSTGSSRSPT